MGNKRLNLELRFDADQVTNALNYKFTGPKGSIFQEDGRCAGTFYFPNKAEVSVNVIGTAKTSDKMRFLITDLTLVSVPRFRPYDSILSPFDASSACNRIGDWNLAAITKSKGLTNIPVSSRKRLKVVKGSGQWEMSGYLSVLIETIGSDGVLDTRSRLFQFDPESTAGSGGGVRN